MADRLRKRTYNPSNLALDQDGNLYISGQANRCVREVSASTGIITTIAGGGTNGLGDGGPATSALIDSPGPLVFDSKGNLYIGEQTGRVRVIDAKSGIIRTFAGNGNAGDTGDGGAAVAAEVYPTGLAVDSADNLYISNASDGIRMVPAGGGVISRVIGVGYAGFGGDEGAASMAELSYPEALAFDKAGNLYIADTNNARVRQVTYSCPAATPAFSLAGGSYQGAQTLTITDTTLNAVIYYTTDGSTPTTGSTVYDGPLAVSSSETLKAIAATTGYTVSAVATADYTIVLPSAPDISAVNSSLNPSMVADPVTFTVGVTSGAGAPSGQVTFMDGSVTLGSAALTGGSATLTTASLAAGSHSITAAYSGDTHFT